MKRGGLTILSTVVLVVAALPASASATFRGANGRIAWAVFNAGGGGGGGFASLTTYHPSGGGRRQLGYCPEDNSGNVCDKWFDATYSPDGAELLWNEPGSSGQRVIMLAAADANLPTAVDHEMADDGQASFSANGHRIVYIRQPMGTGGEFGTIVTSDLKGGSIRVVGSSLHASAPLFTPNGKHILFIREGAFSSAGGLWSIGTNGLGLRRLVAHTVAFDVAPSGRSIAYLTRRGDLYAARADGTGAHRLAHEPVSDLPSPAVRFSPDGQLIAFSAFGPTHDSGATIYTIDASGGKPRVIKDSMDPRTITSGLSWQPLP